MWIRLLAIAFFSVSAVSIFTYQGIEITHALMDFFKKK